MAKITKKVDCFNCNGLCCRSVTLPLETDITKDEIRWLKYHNNIKIKRFKIKNKTYFDIEIKTECKYLKNNRCPIYKNRPAICRKYNCKNTKDEIYAPIFRKL